MADGDARLEAVLEAKVDKLQASLNKALSDTDTWARKTQKHISDTNSSWEKLFGKFEPGKALDKLFSSTRLATLEAGGTRLRLFGSALEPLGPIGITAAAGVAAFGLSLDQADKAIKYADNIYRLAQNAHTTTDELQKFTFALSEAGGEGARAGEGLESFSVKLGLAEAGTKRGLLPFQELFGKTFTKENVRNLGDTGQALIAVTAQIEKLKSPSQKDAVIEQLGLTALKPLIEGGVDKMREFLDAAEKAGVVMDASLIERGHKLNSELETLHTKIDVQLKSAFIELGPILVDIVGKIADMAKFAADAADHLNSIDHQRTQTLVSERAELVARSKDPIHRLLRPDDQQRIAAIDAELANRAAHPAGPAHLPTGNANLHDASNKAGPRDDFNERRDTVAGDLASAEKNRLSAEQALTESIEYRANFERAIIEAELAQSQARLQKQADAINADKGISEAKKKELISALDTAKWTEEQAAAAKLALVDKEEERKTFDASLENNRAINASLDIVDQASADMATTAEARRRIQLAILDDDQRLARIAQKEMLDRAVADKTKTPSEAANELNAGDEARAAQRSLAVFQNAGPIDKYLRSIQDLDTEFQNADVEAARSAASGLADAIVNAKSLGDVASSVFRQLIQQLLEAVIEKDITGPLLALIPGFADGTNYAPGGVALVGERGPELVDLPIGARVIPNHALGSASAMPGVPLRQAPTIVQTFSFDVRGALTTQDVLDQMNRIGQQAAQVGAQNGYQRTMSRIAKSRANVLGR